MERSPSPISSGDLFRQVVQRTGDRVGNPDADMKTIISEMPSATMICLMNSCPTSWPGKPFSLSGLFTMDRNVARFSGLVMKKKVRPPTRFATIVTINMKMIG